MGCPLQEVLLQLRVPLNGRRPLKLCALNLREVSLDAGISLWGVLLSPLMELVLPF